MIKIEGGPFDGESYRQTEEILPEHLYGYRFAMEAGEPDFLKGSSLTGEIEISDLLFESPESLDSENDSICHYQLIEGRYLYTGIWKRK